MCLIMHVSHKTVPDNICKDIFVIRILSAFPSGHIGEKKTFSFSHFTEFPFISSKRYLYF